MPTPKKHPMSTDYFGNPPISGKSIAILPFVNMSSDPENEYFSDGITEEIINAMTKVEGLKVTARTSSFAFKNKNINIQEIGRQLNVTTLLEGSVRVARDQVRITAQLINVEDGFHFWSETFDRKLEDIFGVQEEVSILIAEKLRENLGHFDIADQLSDGPTMPVEIYKQYLKGKYYLRKMNKADTETGLAILLEAIKIAPDHPQLHLEMNYGYSFLGAIGSLPAPVAFAKGKPYLDKAIELDSNHPECLFHQGGIYFWKNWDLKNTYQYLFKALEVRPGFSDAHQSIGAALNSEGKFEAAWKYLDTACQLDPFSPMNHYLKGVVLYCQEKFEEANSYFQKSISLEPHFVFAYLLYGGGLLMSGRIEEGMKIYEQIPQIAEADYSKLGALTLGNAFLKNWEKVEEGEKKLKAAMETDAMGRVMFFLILSYTVLGRHEEALALLEKGMKFRVPTIIMAPVEPMLKPLRKYDLFKEMTQLMFGKSELSSFAPKKYKRSSLKNEEAEEYFNKLNDWMDKEKPYLSPDLSLRNLAKMIDIHPNVLSQLLNERVKKNFSEYVNSYRLETFKSLAKNPANHHLTILALAFDSGFSSKTVFNTYFKKRMGQTPREYWKRMVG